MVISDKSPIFQENAAELVADGEARLAAEGPAPTGSARGDRLLLLWVVAGSLLAHGCLLLAFVSFEHAPMEAERSKEIPVELVNEPLSTPPPQPPPDAAAKPQASAAAPTTEPKPAPGPPEALPRKAEQVATPEPKPAQSKRFEKAAPPAPAKTRSGPSAQTHKENEQKNAVEKASSQPPERRGGDENAPPPQVGLALPFDLGPKIFRAVAVPLPTEGGEEPMSYKLIVFGMLERAKHYPEAALERGAHGISVIGFAIDAAGEVASVSLLRSSGDADLDAESLAVVGRAAPFPAPPAGAQRVFAAEITFGKNSAR